MFIEFIEMYYICIKIFKNHEDIYKINAQSV